MTDNGTGVVRSIPFYSGADCPEPCRPMVPRRERTFADYDPRLLSYAEAARLLQAKTAAMAEQEAVRAQVGESMSAVKAAEVAAVRGIDDVSEFVRDRKLAAAYAAARDVRERHGADGPESRRHRPKRLSVAMWATIALAAIYDTAFLGDMFLMMLNAGWDWTSVVTYIALVPGLLIAVALYVSGQFLGEAFRRSRAHTERSEHEPSGFLRRKSRRRRGATDMPWPRWGVALASLLVVLATLGVWAAIRGQVMAAGKDDELDLQHYPMVMLVLLFSLAAVGMKVLHHNPYIDRSAEVDGELKEAKKAADGLVTKMQNGIGQYAAAVDVLRALGERILAGAQRTLVDALVQIMKDRHEHGLAGETATLFANGSGGETPIWVFADLIDPHVPTDVPNQITEFLRAHDPESLRPRWEEVMRELAASSEPEPGELQANGG